VEQEHFNHVFFSSSFSSFAISPAIFLKTQELQRRILPEEKVSAFTWHLSGNWKLLIICNHIGL